MYMKAVVVRIMIILLLCSESYMPVQDGAWLHNPFHNDTVTCSNTGTDDNDLTVTEMTSRHPHPVSCERKHGFNSYVVVLSRTGSEVASCRWHVSCGGRVEG